MKIEEPDKVEVTLTMTMSVKNWCELRDQLQAKWPSADLSGHITDMLAQVRKIVYPADAD